MHHVRHAGGQSQRRHSHGQQGIFLETGFGLQYAAGMGLVRAVLGVALYFPFVQAFPAEDEPWHWNSQLILLQQHGKALHARAYFGLAESQGLYGRIVGLIALEVFQFFFIKKVLYGYGIMHQPQFTHQNLLKSCEDVHIPPFQSSMLG